MGEVSQGSVDHMLLSTLSVLLSGLALSSACLAPPPPPPPPAPTAAPIVGSCSCGVNSATSTKIVGGSNAGKNEFPWQVGLVPTYSSRPFCGGTLLSSDTVLTAAHCKHDVNAFRVSLGDHDITRSDGEQFISPSQWISHPSYNRANQNYDFAIVKLSSPVTFTGSVLPACLPSAANNYDAVTATVTGWGTLSSGGSQPNLLQKVDVNTMTNSACTSSSTAYGSGDVSQAMICAASPGRDSCQGDSGGPLVTREAGRFYSIIGVVSWGYGCAQSTAPGVYARVTDQLSWINSYVSGTTCPKPN